MRLWEHIAMQDNKFTNEGSPLENEQHSGKNMWTSIR